MSSARMDIQMAPGATNDHMAKSHSGSDGDLTPHKVEIWKTPLPQSGAALFDEFHTYRPKTATSVVNKAHLPRHLTWSFLQNDPNCQELSELRNLVATIFAYSRQDHGNDMSEEEQVAGFCYFIPTGALALEWIKFFDLAPARYLKMAPLQVHCAYKRKDDFSHMSMREWVDAGVATWKTELARRKWAKAPIAQSQTPAEFPQRKRRHSGSYVEDESVALQQSLRSNATSMDDANSPHPAFPHGDYCEANLASASPYDSGEAPIVDTPSSWQPHGAEQRSSGSMDTISVDNGGMRAADLPYLRLGDTVASKNAVPSFITMGHKRQRQEGAQQDLIPSWSMPSLTHPARHGLGSTSVNPFPFPYSANMDPVSVTGDLVQTSTSPGASSSPDQSVSRLGRPLVDHRAAAPRQQSLSQQSSTSQQAVQHTTATLGGPQIPVNTQGATVPAPGSQTHRGKGFCQKGWSQDRVDAWTGIQGRQIIELPAAALSPYGDEISRGHTPKSVDPRYCPFETTMEENLTYLTLATTTNRQLCARTMANWTAQACVHYVYWALDLQDSHSYGRTTIQKQFTKCKEWQTLNPGIPHTATMSNLRPDNNLNGADKDTHDYFLHAMGKNVVKHPTGSGRHNLTMVIEHVVNVSRDKTIRLSEAAQYARRHNLTLLSEPRLLATPVLNDGPNATIIGNARAAYIAKFGKPA